MKAKKKKFSGNGNECYKFNNMVCHHLCMLC